MTRTIGTYYQGPRRALVVGAFAAAALALCQLAIPWVVGRLVDDALLARDAVLLGRLAILLAALAFATGLLQTLYSVTFNWVGEKALTRTQRETLGRLLRLPLAEIENERSGKLQTLLTQDAAQVSRYSEHIVGEAILGTAQLLGLLLLMIVEYGWLTLLIAPLTPLYLIVPKLLQKRARRASVALQNARAEVNTTIQETVQGAREIKSFGRERWATERLQPLLRQRLRRRLSFSILSGAEWINYGLSFTIGAGVYWIGGLRVIAGEMSPGQVVTLVAIFGYLESPLNRLTRLYMEIQTVRASADRLAPVLDARSEADSTGPALALGPGPYRVDFDQVSFRYDASEPPVLDDVSFHAPAGALIALVGPSGAGKSTLVSLLPRLYLPQVGKVKLNGLALERYDLTSLRGSIGVVSQDPVLFPGSVTDNVLFGRDWASPAEVEKAARIANAHDFISALPGGYGTEIGERGVKLSGGQRQRLAIARAILGDPGLLILDEATSALDSESEDAVRRALESARRDRTTFVVSHRLSSVRDADQILVLDGGRLIAAGSHDQLVDHCDLYARLSGDGPRRLRRSA